MQFQFTLPAKTLDRERAQQTLPHFPLPQHTYRITDPTHPPWEMLPYMRRTLPERLIGIDVSFKTIFGARLETEGDRISQRQMK